MTISNITALPPAPNRTDPTTFADKGDAMMTALVAFVPQMNTAIGGINSAQAGADTDAATATSSAANAAAAANTSASTAKAVAWVGGSTYQLNDCAVSQINFQTYRKKTTATTNTGGATDPANDATNWIPLSTQMAKSARTSNTALAPTDARNLIDITSGTFTQTFNAAATLGIGWYCFIRNSGSGYITLDPNGSELIDGLTTIVMMPGEVRVLQCDGAAFTSLLINTEGYFYAREEQNSNAGPAALGAVLNGTRVLNSVKANTINATLSSNQVTLQPGTYRVKARSPFSATQGARIVLYNVTDSTTVIVGSSCVTNPSYTFFTVDSFVSGVFTISAAKVLALNFFVGNTTGTGGLQTNAGGNVEVYTELEFWKIA